MNQARRVSMGNARGSDADRGDDVYETPCEAVHALMAAEKLPRFIFEPCCGSGNVVKTLRSAGHVVFAYDITDQGCPDAKCGVEFDFLMCRKAPTQATAIVTNPPYKLAAEFVAHALTMVPRVYMLLRLNFLEAGSGRSERSKLRAQILDGGQLARVLVFRNRLPRMHRQGWTGNRCGSTMPMAWFVWERTRRVDVPAAVMRITWKPIERANALEAAE